MNGTGEGERVRVKNRPPLPRAGEGFVLRPRLGGRLLLLLLWPPGDSGGFIIIAMLVTLASCSLYIE